MTTTSWRPEVQLAGEGGKWSSNALRFATEQEAQDNARDLMARWLMVTAYRAAPSDDPVNYRWTESGLVSITEESKNG